MEQRRLRLGDILDDYCPRERRVTNHAIVAMIDHDVKQTRCTTCDAEHPYRGGKVPRQKKRTATAALYKEVLAGMPESEPAPVLTGGAPPPAEYPEPVPPPEPYGAPQEEETPVPARAGEAATSGEQPESAAQPLEDGPVHRPLIRATLPRPEGQKDTRPMPEFTVRARGNGSFRGGDVRMKQRGGHSGNGQRGHGQRFAGPHGGGRGPAGRSGNFRSAQQPRHGGKKRSR